MIKPDPAFAQALLSDLASGVTPHTRAGVKGMRPTLAMVAIGAMLTLANGPVEAQQSWIQKMATGVGDLNRLKRAGEVIDDNVSRVGSSDKDRLLGDIERALRSIDAGQKQAQRASDRNGISFPRGDDNATPSTGGRPNSELFGPGY